MATYVRVRWASDEYWIPTELLAELDEDGLSLREVGLDESGTVIHRCPDPRFREGKRGFISEYPISLEDPGMSRSFVVLSSSKEEFEAAFSKAAIRPRRPSLLARLARLLHLR